MDDKEKQLLEFMAINERINSIPDRIFKLMLDECINRKQPLEFVAGDSTLAYRFGVSLYGPMFTPSRIAFTRVGPELDITYRRSLAMQLAAKTCRVSVHIRNKAGGCWSVPVPISVKQ